MRVTVKVRERKVEGRKTSDWEISSGSSSLTCKSLAECRRVIKETIQLTLNKYPKAKVVIRQYSDTNKSLGGAVYHIEEAKLVQEDLKAPKRKSSGSGTAKKTTAKRKRKTTSKAKGSTKRVTKAGQRAKGRKTTTKRGKGKGTTKPKTTRSRSKKVNTGLPPLKKAASKTTTKRVTATKTTKTTGAAATAKTTKASKPKRKPSAYNKFVKKFSASYKGPKKDMMKAAGAAWQKEKNK